MKVIEKIRSRLSLKRLIGGGLVFLILFSVTGFFVLPPVVKSVALEKLSEKLKREVTIETVKINPFMLSLTIQGATIKEPGSPSVFASFDKLYLNFQAISVFRRGLIAKEIRLEKPYLHIVRNEDLLYNFSDLLKKESEPSTPFLFSLNNIQIIGGSIDFIDGPKHTKHVVKDAALAVPFLSNLPYYLEAYVQPSFSAQINGHSVLLKGTTKPFADSVETSFNINIKDLDIPYYLAYAPFRMDYRLVSGFFDTQSSISFIQYKNRQPSISLKGASAFRNIAIYDNRDSRILELPRVDIGIASSDIMEKNVHFSKISVESPAVDILRDRTGKMNIQALVPETDRKSDETAGTKQDTEDLQKPVIEADEIMLAAGRVAFVDLAENRNFRTVLEEIQLKINNFSTAKEKMTNVEASLQTEAGEQLQCAGSFSIEPLVAEGRFEAKKVILKKYSPYYHDKVLFSVEGGELGFLTKFFFRKTNKGPDIRLAEMAVDLAALRLRKNAEKEDFLKVPLFSIKDSTADLGRRELVIGSLSTQKGALAVTRYADGNLNLATLLPPPPPAEHVPVESKKSVQDTTPWTVTLKKIAAEQYGVRVEDHTTSAPFSLDLSRINLRAENLSTMKKARGNATLSLKVERVGTVRVSGTISIDPFTAQVRLVTKDIPLMPVQPYFTDKVKIFVTDGSLSSSGDVLLGYTKESGMKASYKGEASLNHFASVDMIEAEDFLKWSSLYFSGMDIGYAPLSVNISEVALTDLYSRLIINADGSLNVQNIMAKEEKTPESEGATDKKPAPNDTQQNQGRTATAGGKDGSDLSGNKDAFQKMIKIDNVTLQGGTINFSDHYIKPNYSANLLEVGGRVTGLSSEETRMADVDLRGKLDNYAPLEISGKINPLREDLYVDLTVDFRDMDLSPTTPYSGKFIGYTIEKGKLSIGLQYLIVKKKLDAQNRVLLDQLTLGDKVDSPDATKLPVKLAIALLKNRKGEIDLNLPVTGQLDDPKFSLGSIIIKILINLLVKAATSPFALLGAIFGGGEELSYLDFEPGSYALGEAGTKKLETLVKALYERPALKLEIEGHVDLEKDKEGLRQYFFHKKIKAQKLKESVKAGKPSIPVDEVTIEQNEYQKYLKLAYKAEKFPKPRNIIGMAKDLPGPEMEKLMFTHIEIKDDDLRSLASQRALTVKDYILKSKQVEPERVFLVEPKTLQPEKKETLRDSRVDFRLK